MAIKSSPGESLRKRGISGKRKSSRVERAYARCYEGYAEGRVPKKNGKGEKTVRVYVGDYHVQDMPRGMQIAVRVLCAVLYICAATLYAVSGIKHVFCNFQWYVQLPQAVCIFPLYYMLRAVICYACSMGNVKADEYRRSSLAIKKHGWWAPIPLAVVAAAMLVASFFAGAEGAGPSIGCAVMNAAAALMLLAIYVVERSVRYLVVPSGVPIPKDYVLVKPDKS